MESDLVYAGFFGEEWFLNLDTVLQGLVITIVGMGLVFLALGLIVLAIVLMGRYLRPRASAKDEPSEVDPNSEERARVAVIAAAIVLARATDESHDPVAWDVTGAADTSSAWQASHRARSLARRP
jgi:sodium pump decarboxylase gamma subunit